MAIMNIDGNLFREMLTSGANLLEQNREAVDALNVFPVPDGDTGSNMSRTFSAAIREMGLCRSGSVADIADAVARGALKGARGNSGVILSQILRGIARGLAGHEQIDCALWIRAMREGALTAYKAVMKPKEGTILTVIRVISEELTKGGKNCRDMVELFDLLVSSGDAILRRTQDMLPVLKQAGVVDSGGKGLLIIFTGMRAALTGEVIDLAPDAAPAAMPGEYVDDHGDLSPEEIVYGYCTEFIVSRPRPDMKDADVTRLRARLEKIGDCVLVISDLSVVKVHVHTDEPGRALQYAMELGELDAIKIDNMRQEARERAAKRAEQAAATATPPAKYGIVAVALGEGVSALFKKLNVGCVVDGGQTMNPSTQDLSDAIAAVNAENVFILPNNSNIIMAANQAAGLSERNVVVIPTKSVPMGVSAAIAFDPEADVEANAQAMTEAAEAVHTASVTYAIRDTTYDDHPIRRGDIMGMVDNKLTEVGSDIADVAETIVAGMVTEDSFMITVYYGQDIAEEDAQALAARLEERFGDCEVQLQYGGQPLYYYLIAVE